MNLDGYPLPEAFKTAWMAAFRPAPGSVEHLARLINLTRGLGSFGLDGDYSPETARRELDREFSEALRAGDIEARIHKLFRAAKMANNPRLHLATREITMRIYFAMVRDGCSDITKKLLWEHVREAHKVLKISGPYNRDRVLAAIGLADLPKASSGRPRKK
jgi:hypothetical protein